jgi:glycosyltransferase involved in cell wall biosynthesis
LRILYLNHNPAGVGTWQRASHFGRALARRGHEVTLVTTDPRRRFGFDVRTEGPYTEIRAPDLLVGPARTGWDPSNALRRVLRLNGHRADLVHAFDARPVVIAPALHVARRTGAALFMDWADWWGRGGRIEERSGWWVRTFFGPVETWFEESFRTRAHGTTTISRSLAERASGLGVDPARIWTLPNGCDADGVRPLDRDAARRALGVPLDTPLVLHAGVLTPGDMAQLTTAFATLAEELPAARLVLVGNHTAPVPADALASGRVEAVGFVSAEALQLWLAASDVCVIPLTDTPNNRGRWPGRLNDYLAAGRPTVMSGVGDAADLLGAEGAGWTCGADPESLARSLLAALRDDDGRRIAGERARALATGPLAWSALAARLEAAYNAVLDPGSGSVTTRAQETTRPLTSEKVNTDMHHTKTRSRTENRSA